MILIPPGGAGTDMSDLAVKIAYENNADTNAFTDAEKVSLAAAAPLESPTFTGAATFDTTTLAIDSVNRRVGIGIVAPETVLHIKGPLTVSHPTPVTGTCKLTCNIEDNSQVSLAYDDEGAVVFGTSSEPTTQATFAERMRLDSNGYLRLAGSGIQFNGDSAEANALNDYEEGYWVPTLSNGGTRTVQSARYTKIGRQVTVTCYLSGITPTADDANLLIGGLPFTCGLAYAAAAIGYTGTSTLTNWMAYVGIQLNRLALLASGVPVTNNDYIAAAGSVPSLVLTATYFI